MYIFSQNVLYFVGRGRGRPRIQVDMSAVEYYFIHGLTLEHIAQILGVSKRTIATRMKAANIRLCDLSRRISGISLGFHEFFRKTIPLYILPVNTI
jgi:hypothetical protein